MTRDYTTVNTKPRTWKQLNARKDPGDSFDDVIQRLLDNQPDPVDSEQARRDVESLEFRRGLTKTEARVDVLTDILVRLRRGERFTKQELENMIHTYPELGDITEDPWYKGIITPLKTLDDIDAIQTTVFTRIDE